MSFQIPKRVAAIHDISGFGRCSLSVIIPILSAMGIQVCPAPTAVLSTHTGGFEDFTFTDMTPVLARYFAHWLELGIGFDCIYSGFLGSKEQIDIIIDFIDQAADALVVVDPVFADDGELYSTLDASFINHMRRLIRHAHVITPNITEAAFLLEEKMPESLNISEAKQWLMRLCAMAPTVRMAVITGVVLEGGQYCVMAYDRADGRFWKVAYEFIPQAYPGTGDIFTSVIIGGLLRGETLPRAAAKAADFVSEAIRATYGRGLPPREGVLLERVLCDLAQEKDVVFEEI